MVKYLGMKASSKCWTYPLKGTRWQRPVRTASKEVTKYTATLKDICLDSVNKATQN